jgi:hypothetical protein
LDGDRIAFDQDVASTFAASGKPRREIKVRGTIVGRQTFSQLTQGMQLQEL